MSLPAQALTTVLTLRQELGQSDQTKDTLLERYILGASSAIAGYCGRAFHREAMVAERVKGFGGCRLLVSRTPVVSVSAITKDGQTVDATSYYVESAGAGFIYRPNGWDWTAPFRDGLAAPGMAAGEEESSYLVSYVGGWVTPAQSGTGTPALVRDLPNDIEEACIECCVQLFRKRGKRMGLDLEDEADSQTQWSGRLLTGTARSIMRRYRRLS